jgi:hypothetical protein
LILNKKKIILIQWNTKMTDLNICLPCEGVPAVPCEGVPDVSCIICTTNLGYTHTLGCNAKMCLVCYKTVVTRQTGNRYCPLKCCYLPRRLPADIESIEKIPSSITRDVDGNPLKCPYCNVICKNLKRLEKHRRSKCQETCQIYMEKKSKKCLDCGEPFVMNHKNLCSAVMPCPDCGETPQMISSQDYRNNSRQSYHKMYYCPTICKICNSDVTGGKYGLKNHLDKACPRKCRKCDAQFSGIEDLTFHQKHDLCPGSKEEVRPQKSVWSSTKKVGKLISGLQNTGNDV